MVVSDEAPRSDPVATCSTFDSFEPYGIEDGSVLVDRAALLLDVPMTVEVTATDDVLSATSAAFRESFRRLTGRQAIPEPVAAAVDDAAAWTADDLGGATVDVETTLLPEFYRQLAAFHCTYRERRAAPRRR